ncbi:MAG: hypothetical protein OXE50_03305 [Chloroflexi bacterium]|nr:hypothetical protein [Chloroflexota bacterium]
MMGRTERITVVTLGVVFGVALLILLGLVWVVVSDLRQTVSSVDGVVREIAKVQGVQEGVLNRLDTLPVQVDGDDGTPAGSTPADPGAIRPGRPSVSARQLWDDFDANQVRAYETYSEPRVWAVSGTVDSVQYADSSYIYVGLNGLVRVGFRSDYERDWLDEIDKGEHIWLECEVRGPDEDGLIVCISPND